MAPATYQCYVDWDNDGGLHFGGFESGLDGWIPGGSVPPTLTRSTVRSYHGAASALITWGAGGTLPLIHRAPDNLVAGTQYTLSAWVYVPSGSVHVLWAVAGVSLGSASTVTDQWARITHTFTATVHNHGLQIWPNGTPAGGEQVWVDFMQILGPGEDVSEDLREPITMQYGRDQDRALSPARPGEANFDLNNRSRTYSPENGSSPLSGKLGTGREILQTATLNNHAYAVYQGYLDDYDLAPDLESESVGLTAVDGLGRVRGVPISTALYPALRTGDAVHRVLDAVGWTGPRDVDPGGSTLRWWWEEGDAGRALDHILNAEGPPSLVHIGADGRFIFRDRHHRLLRTASTTLQATFRADEGTEPVFLQPFEYNIGWRDIINVVEFSVTERAPGLLEKVWEDTRTIRVSPGQTYTIDVVFKEPVWAVQQPTVGAAVTDPDIINSTANTLNAVLSRTSGKELQLHLSVPVSAGGAAEVNRVRLRGHPLETVREVKVTAEDTSSIAVNGRRSNPSSDAPHINVEDAAAVAAIILGQRAERLPTVAITIVGVNDTRLTQQLTRDLSDRMRIIEPETGLDAHFYLEAIRHAVSEGSRLHTTRFGCEKIRTAPGNLFIFDQSGHGFNDGVFAPSGLDDPANMFIFDQASHGFDDGLFAT